MPNEQETHSMDPFLQDLLKASMSRITTEQGDASKNFLAMLDRAFGKVYAEMDPGQAAAIRQILHRETPMNASDK